MYSFLIFLLLISFAPGIAATSVNETTTDFNYLNKLRLQTGLLPFKWNETLRQAAQNHADYLTLNQQHGHYEQPNQAGYSGEWAADRAVYVNYPNQMVSENVTSKKGANDYYNPIDSLMSAIYHRFGFLDLTQNEVGIGHAIGDINSYVYVMGNSDLSELCQQPSYDQPGYFYNKICQDPNIKLNKQAVDKTKSDLQRQQPDAILWPPENAVNIAPVFYEESPDPLPHHSVSGYPVSLEFNPFIYERPPQLISFKLFRDIDQSEVSLAHTMSEKTDPNQKFSAYQHAIFPDQRLDWNTSYTAKIEYLTDVGYEQKQWQFTTQNPDGEFHIIKDKLYQIRPNINQKLVLYLPPEHARDIKTALSFKQFRLGLQVDYLDKNTLSVIATDWGEGEIHFHNKIIRITIPQ